MNYAKYSPHGKRRQQHPIKLSTLPYLQLKELATLYGVPQAHILETLIQGEYTKCKLETHNTVNDLKLTPYRVLSALN